MKTIFIENCPRCSTPMHKTLTSDGVDVDCKCGYLLDYNDGKIECSYYYGGYFIYSSEWIGETAFNLAENLTRPAFWIKRVLDPLTTNEELDKILLLI